MFNIFNVLQDHVSEPHFKSSLLYILTVLQEVWGLYLTSRYNFITELCSFAHGQLNIHSQIYCNAAVSLRGGQDPCKLCTLWVLYGSGRHWQLSNIPQQYYPTSTLKERALDCYQSFATCYLEIWLSAVHFCGILGMNGSQQEEHRVLGVATG